MDRSNRPLSPHLQVYRFQWNMTLSMLHRFTGVALALGTLLLAWWLIAAAAGPEAYAVVQGFAFSMFGRLVLLGFTFALFYHLCNGVRHLLWDIGLGFEPSVAAAWGWIAFAASIVMTVLAWLLGYALRGGL